MPNTLRNALPHGEVAGILLLALAGLIVLLLIGWMFLLLRLRRLSRQLAALTLGVEGQNLEQTLVTHLERVDQTVQRMEALEQAVGVIQAQVPECLQKAHLVRYNAFDDVGGEQSFSLALLDGHGDGVVITSVFSRMDVRVYAKAIRDGHASHALSREEERALQGIVAQ